MSLGIERKECLNWFRLWMITSTYKLNGHGVRLLENASAPEDLHSLICILGWIIVILLSRKRSCEMVAIRKFVLDFSNYWIALMSAGTNKPSVTNVRFPCSPFSYNFFFSFRTSWRAIYFKIRNASQLCIDSCCEYSSFKNWDQSVISHSFVAKLDAIY